MEQKQQETEELQPDKQETKFVRNEEDFVSLYANDVTIEANTVDLKLVFGELDLQKKRVEQHTAITIPWVQAKIFAYHLAVFIAQHEAMNGKIKIPIGVLPDLTAIPENVPSALRPVYILAQGLHHKLVEDLARPES